MIRSAVRQTIEVIIIIIITIIIITRFCYFRAQRKTCDFVRWLVRVLVRGLPRPFHVSSPRAKLSTNPSCTLFSPTFPLERETSLSLFLS